MNTYSEYKCLSKFINNLRIHFIHEYPINFKIGQVYKGNKEISFFTFTPTVLQQEKLKIAIVFNFQKNRFEIWLAGQNRKVQKKYWSIFKDSDWNKYHIPENPKEGFSIIDHIIVENPDFQYSDELIQTY